MKAAVLHAFKAPLSLEEVARPEAGADDVVIKVEVCGVCHSDLHVADGDWTQFAGIVKKPLILGHEIVGRVVERGAGVTVFRWENGSAFRGCSGHAGNVSFAAKATKICV